MTLYYTLVFMLLVAEIFLFLMLIVPFPLAIRRRIFTFISENALVAKLQYGLKIAFIFILVLFIDSVNRVYRVQLELAAASETHSSSGAAIMGHERLEVQARKFYSQRNMYLCGSTLFLSLILNQTYTMILKVLRLEESNKLAYAELKRLKDGGASGDDKLLKELAKKDVEIEAIKRQASGLHREYDELCEKYAATQKDGSPKKSI